MKPFTNQDHLSDETLSAWLDGYLSEAEGLIADRHLGTCRSCATRYAGLRAMRDALRHLEPVALPRDFRLTPAGRPKSAALPPPTIRGGMGPWMVARVASAAVAFVGMLLLGLGLLGTVNNHDLFSMAAGATTSRSATLPDSTLSSATPCVKYPCSAGATQGTATADHRPMTATPGATKVPTALTGVVNGPTATLVPTPLPTAVATQTPTPTVVADRGQGNGNNSIGVAFLGLFMTIAGIIGLLFARRR